MARSFDRVATVMREYDVRFDFLGYQGSPKTVLLFSDVRFIVWLMRKRYRKSGLPLAVGKVLDEARRTYILMVAVSSIIVFLAILNALYINAK